MGTQQHRDSLAAAILAESVAYATMRDLVPDLALPLAQRVALSRRQQAAVADYEAARERLRLARLADAAPCPCSC
jgi:hypothetical protein